MLLVRAAAAAADNIMQVNGTERMSITWASRRRRQWHSRWREGRGEETLLQAAAVLPAAARWVLD